MQKMLKITSNCQKKKFLTFESYVLIYFVLIKKRAYIPTNTGNTHFL